MASMLGKMGGMATLKKHGKDKMTEWGKKGGRPKNL
jgi:general stress protein YciG